MNPASGGTKGGETWMILVEKYRLLATPTPSPGL